MCGYRRFLRILPGLVLILGAVASVAPASPVLAASLPYPCPTTDAQLSSDISNVGDGGTVALACSTPTTTAFTSTIAITDAVTLDASTSPAPITFDGGGSTRLFNVNSGANLTLVSLTLQNASPTCSSSFCAVNGGAIQNNGTLSITDSTLSGNSPTCSGSPCIVDGGAIYNIGTLTITDSTLSANSPTCSGSGCIDIGGAIGNLGTLTITSSTLSGNSPTCSSLCVVDGGAIYNGATMTVGGTIVAGNAPNGSLQNCYNNGGTITDDGYNLTDDTTCGFSTANHDIIETTTAAVGLATTTPQVNGGRTETIALSSTSPAIDAIPVGAPFCPTPDTDQRGVPRPMGNKCDIGAYEYAGNNGAWTSGCPTTESALNTDLTTGTLANGGAFFFDCSSDTTITFNTTINLLDEQALVGNDGPGRVDFDGGTSTQPFNVSTKTGVGLAAVTFTHGSNRLGGAIDNDGTLTVTGSTFSGNSGTFGGAIQSDGSLVVTTSTFFDNSSSYVGGAIYNNGAATIINSTFSGNAASYLGGAILNGAATLNIGGTIIANSTSGGNCYYANSTRTDWGYNLTDSNGNCALAGATDQTGVDPKLGPLQDNGGPTDTMALLPGSPAIDQIPLNYTDSGAEPNLCLGNWTDQRGYVRPDDVESLCDIGAYESDYQPTTLAVQSASGRYGGTTTLSATLTDSTGTGIANEPITFYLNGTAVCGGTSQPSCPTTGDGSNGTTLGVATLSGASLGTINAGTYPSTGPCSSTSGVSASFAGDVAANLDASSACNTLTVNPATTQLSLSTQPNPSVSGQSVTFTATISVTEGGGTPTGTVEFQDNGTDISGCSSRPVSTTANVTTATCTTSTLPVGSDSVTAAYTPDTGNFTKSTGTLSPNQQVNQADTTTTLSSSQNPSTTGHSVTFTAAVAVVSPGSGTPTGTVEFQDNGSDIPTCSSQMVSTITETATCQTSSLSAGVHTITAVYLGDTNFTGSTGSLDQDVSFTVPNGKSAYDIESSNWSCANGGIACLPGSDTDASQCVSMTPCPGASYGDVEAFGSATNATNGIPDELILACVQGTNTGYRIGYLDVLSHQGSIDYPGGIDGTADQGTISGQAVLLGGGGGVNNPSQPSSVNASVFDPRTGIIGSVSGTQNTDNGSDTLNSGGFRVTIRGKLWTVTNGQTPTRNTISTTMSCTVGGSHATDLHNAGLDSNALAEGELESSLGDNFFLPPSAAS